MITVDNEKELGQCIKSKEDEIAVEGKLAKKVLKLKATSAVQWAVAVSAIGAVIASSAAMPMVGPLVGPIAPIVTAGIAGPIIVSLGGLPTTISAVKIAAAAGGKDGLDSLYKDYTIEQKDDRRVNLHRK